MGDLIVSWAWHRLLYNSGAPAGCAPFNIFRAARGMGPQLGEPGRPDYQMRLATAMSSAASRLRGWLDSLPGGSLLRSRLFLHRRGLLRLFLVMVSRRI